MAGASAVNLLQVSDAQRHRRRTLQMCDLAESKSLESTWLWFPLAHRHDSMTDRTILMSEDKTHADLHFTLPSFRVNTMVLALPVNNWALLPRAYILLPKLSSTPLDEKLEKNKCTPPAKTCLYRAETSRGSWSSDTVCSVSNKQRAKYLSCS